MSNTAEPSISPPEPTPSPGEITLLLERWVEGDESAGESLLTAVYDELRRLAGRYLKKERADHTLPPTGLVHEAYMRLVQSDLQKNAVGSRGHFFAVAAQAMRRILVEHARRYETKRRASPKDREEMPSSDQLSDELSPVTEILAIDEALEKLRLAHPRKAQVVELRYFAGLTEEEIADALEVSRATVSRDWRVARLFLSRSLRPSLRTEAG